MYPRFFKYKLWSSVELFSRHETYSTCHLSLEFLGNVAGGNLCDNVSRHHIIFFFLDHEIIDYFFVMTFYDKFTCKYLFIFSPFCQQIFLTPSKQDVHVYIFTMMYMFCKLHLYKIHLSMHPSRIEPETLWIHTKILNTKLHQQFTTRDEKI